MRNIEARRAWAGGRYRDPKPVPSAFDRLCADLNLDPDDDPVVLTSNLEIRYFVKQFAGRKWIPEGVLCEMRMRPTDPEQAPRGYLICPAPPPIMLGSTESEEAVETESETISA